MTDQVAYYQKVYHHFMRIKRILRLPRSWRVKIYLNNDITEYANVEYDYTHRRFTISINPSKNQKLDDLKDSITHELIHVLLSPATNKIDKILLKIEKKQKINVTKTREQLDNIEEDIVRHFSLVLFNLLKEK